MTFSSPPLDRLGLEVGHYTDPDALTGVTAFIAKQGASIGIHIPGGSAGTYNTPIFGPSGAAEVTNAVVLSGGSSYGLVSAFGTMRWLEENAIGTIFGTVRVPLVTGAVIFDLLRGRGDVRPTEANGYEAAANASSAEVGTGAVGVGTGATTGKWYRGKLRRGGFATSTIELPHGLIVSAFVVANAIGDVGGTGDPVLPDPGDDLRHLDGVIERPTSTPATTLAVIATNAALARPQLCRIASVGAQGFVRSTHPASLLSDGDTVFALSSLTGERLTPEGVSRNTLVDVVGIGAAEAVRRATLAAVGGTDL